MQRKTPPNPSVTEARGVRPRVRVVAAFCDVRTRSPQGGIPQSSLCFSAPSPAGMRRLQGRGRARMGTGKPQEVRRWDAGGLGRSVTSPLLPEESTAP